MGFFTKKEKKPREIKETDSTFVKLWYNPRTHAMMVLGAYFVFFLVVILFLKSLPNNQTVETKKKTGESIEELFKNDPYKIQVYDVVIKTGENTYLFNGSNIMDEIIQGKLVNKDNTIELRLENDSCKVMIRDKKNNLIESDQVCPGDIKYDYLDRSKLYSMIKSLEIKEEDGYYQIKSDDNIEYKIYYIKENEKNILTKTIITNGQSEYEINYSYVDNQTITTFE